MLFKVDREVVFEVVLLEYVIKEFVILEVIDQLVNFLSEVLDFEVELDDVCVEIYSFYFDGEFIEIVGMLIKGMCFIVSKSLMVFEIFMMMFEDDEVVLEVILCDGNNDLVLFKIFSENVVGIEFDVEVF